MGEAFLGGGGHGRGDRGLKFHAEYRVRSAVHWRRRALRCGLMLGLPLLVAACAVPRSFTMAAFDTVTEEIYTGTFFAIGGEPTAVVSLLGSTSGVECQGASGVGETGSVQVGDIGNLIVLCDDGRIIRGQIVYGGDRAGFGAGRDSDQSPYRFLFGRFTADESDLRAQFAVLIAAVPRDDEPLDTLFDEPAPEDSGEEIAVLEEDGDDGFLDDVFGDDEEGDDSALLDDVFGDDETEDDDDLLDGVFGGDEEEDEEEDVALLDGVFGDDEEDNGDDGLFDGVFDDDEEEEDVVLLDDAFGAGEDDEDDSLLDDVFDDEEEELIEEELEEEERRRLAAADDEADELASEDEEDTQLAQTTDEDQDSLAETAAEDAPAPPFNPGGFDLTDFEIDDDISRPQD